MRGGLKKGLILNTSYCRRTSFETHTHTHTQIEPQRYTENAETRRDTQRHTETHSPRQTDRQTGRQTDRQTDRQADRQTKPTAGSVEGRGNRGTLSQTLVGCGWHLCCYKTLVDGFLLNTCRMRFTLPPF